MTATLSASAGSIAGPAGALRGARRRSCALTANRPKGVTIAS